MKDSVAVLLAACLLAAPEFGQVHSLPSTLTPDQTQDAIDWGMGKLKVDGKEFKGNQQYQIAPLRHGRPRWSVLPASRKCCSCPGSPTIPRRPFSPCDQGPDQHVADAERAEAGDGHLDRRVPL